jgi:hypothetical protein
LLLFISSAANHRGSIPHHEEWHSPLADAGDPLIGVPYLSAANGEVIILKAGAMPENGSARADCGRAARSVRRASRGENLGI